MLNTPGPPPTPTPSSEQDLRTSSSAFCKRTREILHRACPRRRPPSWLSSSSPSRPHAHQPPGAHINGSIHALTPTNLSRRPLCVHGSIPARTPSRPHAHQPHPAPTLMASSPLARPHAHQPLPAPTLRSWLHPRPHAHTPTRPPTSPGAHFNGFISSRTPSRPPTSPGAHLAFMAPSTPAPPYALTPTNLSRRPH
ncbi:putative proline-rich protein 21 [Penaeus vannamei]|uniref:putative proline-rich protein 21 n=1 Tax=Penaeus vannamei TaxID=6689 RepID=UPI00387F6D62